MFSYAACRNYEVLGISCTTTKPVATTLPSAFETTFTAESTHSSSAQFTSRYVPVTSAHSKHPSSASPFISPVHTSTNAFLTDDKKISVSSLTTTTWICISFGIVAFLVVIVITTLFYFKRHRCVTNSNTNKQTSDSLKNCFFSCGGDKPQISKISNENFGFENKYAKSVSTTSSKTTENMLYNGFDSVTNENSQSGYCGEAVVFESKPSLMTENILYDGQILRQQEVNEQLKSQNDFCVYAKPTKFRSSQTNTYQVGN